MTKQGVAVRTRFASSYRQSFERLRATLEPRLARFDRVVTHNPWGEYGHEDHAQLSRVVEAVAEQRGFEVWCSNYCGSRALHLAEASMQEPNRDYVRLSTNKRLAHQLRDLYVDEMCWTYAAGYEWFDDECFARVRPLPPGPAARRGSFFPLNILRNADLVTRFPLGKRQPGRR
jgi:LmbE family N-acetylglucosaminyl deacetylase